MSPKKNHKTKKCDFRKYQIFSSESPKKFRYKSFWFNRKYKKKVEKYYIDLKKEKKKRKLD